MNRLYLFRNVCAYVPNKSHHHQDHIWSALFMSETSKSHYSFVIRCISPTNTHMDSRVLQYFNAIINVNRMLICILYTIKHDFRWCVCGALFLHFTHSQLNMISCLLFNSTRLSDCERRKLVIIIIILFCLGDCYSISAYCIKWTSC